MKSVLSVSTGHCLAAAAWQILLCKLLMLLLGQNCAHILVAVQLQVEPEQIDREGGDRLLGKI